MAQSLYSPSWYRVADLRPRLRSHAEVHRQQFRDRIWYVVQDHATGRFHRFSPAAHCVIGLMNGRRTMQEIWDRAAERLGNELPTQDEIIQLLGQLHHSDVLHCDLPPDVTEVAGRSEKIQRKIVLQSLKNPLAIRIPILDPDRFLVATLPLVRPLLGWFGALLWLGVVLYGLALAGTHWSALTENVVDRVTAASNIALLVLAYIVIKALHELGHAYATRRWGGEVHDIGIMLLVLMPIPYVDATAASAFPEKWRRAFVGAAGILVEVFLAALAMIAWTMLEPGLLRAFVFNVMLIAGVSTLLFNGNPLLRFDGYYVLADLVEIPNLGTRSNQYLLYLVQRYAFGIRDLESIATASGERAWFVAYGLASFAYRVFIMAVIVFFIAGQFFIIGVLLAIWGVVIMVLAPLGKGTWFLLTSPRLYRRRRRAVGMVGAVVAGLLAFVLLIPMPHATVAEGVVWVPEQSIVRSEADGYVDTMLAPSNTRVRAGEPLVTLTDPFLDAEVTVLRARIGELELRHAAAFVRDRVQADLVRERLDQTVAELERARQRLDDLALVSPATGTLLMLFPEDMPGRYVRKGDTLGYVVAGADPIVRVVVPQSDIDLVRQRMHGISVRFASNLDLILPATLQRETPAATVQLPSRALSTLGGGAIDLDPTSGAAGQDTAFQSLFQLDLLLPAGATDGRIGARVYVRFDHGEEVLARRLYRRARQLFLAKFDV